MKQNDDKPRLKLIGGQWYAVGKNTKGGRLLVPAIRFCQRLNLMSRTYPRVMDTRYQRKKAGKKWVEHSRCVVCGAPAEFKVFVQVNWFRGEDEGPFKACREHKTDAYALLATQEQKPAEVAA